MAKKLPEPPRSEQTKDQGSLFSDQQLWSYKHGKSSNPTKPKGKH